MSLTSGRGPLSADPIGWFVPSIPPSPVYVEPFPRRVRAVRGGDTLIDTEQAVLVHRAGSPPVYAFPPDAVTGLPTAPEPAAGDMVTVAWDAADAWFEEEEAVLLHASNPYHRVEYLRSRRRLRVALGSITVVDTTDTVAVYETALAPRLYVRRDQVRAARLERSATTSTCPYKGTATWWHAEVDGARFDDVAWSYDDPRPEALAIAGLLSFDHQRCRLTADFPTP